MPLRKTPLITNCYYHVYNRGVNKQPIFNNPTDYKRAIDTITYYSISKPPLRYSHFKELKAEEKQLLFANLLKSKKAVDILCFCLIPNHFHFLVRQNEDNGIIKFRKFQISYTKYLNTKYNRVGPLLQGQFKAVLVEDDYQLLHLSRYIHLNPYTSFKVKNFNDLSSYPWSSWREYVDPSKNKANICSKNEILSHFESAKDYKNFVLDNADYQRELEKIKHLLLEN